MTPEEFEAYRHRCEVRDVIQRIRAQPREDRESWFASYIALVCERRSTEAGERLYNDVVQATKGAA